jgi:predicted lysophospholipase L1 biosynthesis ABC-type transport system permease subunit
VETADGDEQFGVVLVDFAAGAEGARARAALADGGMAPEPPERPASLTNVARVEAVPHLVAGLLVALAAVAAAHALVSSVRRRAGDLALLRTFGFVDRQVRSTIAWQATTLATVGLLVGIPAGFVAGRAAWRVVAGRLGVALHAPAPVSATLLTVAGALAVVNAIAVVAARGAVRAPLHASLRTE